MFRGSYVALVTPMDEQGAVDYAALERLVQFHIQQGTHGLVAVGTTGESATLPFDEHIEVVRRVVEYSDKAVPVIAGSGANSTSEAIFLSEQMATTGIDGFLSVVPYYNKPQQRGMVAHFNAIADATDLPVLLYNVPGRTVADMQVDTVAELAEHKNIVGLKDATGDLQRLHDTKARVPDDFVLLSGDDATSCEFLCAGGDGVISVTANIAPGIIAAMCEACAKGEFEQARQLNRKVADLHEALFIEPNPVMPKWALYKMAMIKTANLRLPMVLPELASQSRIEQVIKDCQLL